jgi:hypothetical protein
MADPCVFCDPHPVRRDDERAGRWLEAGQLCHDHAERACLPDGQPLAAYVRSAPFQLEGSLLAYVLNPLTVDGRRAWSLWAAGGYGVWAELFQSADPFEFQALHMPEAVQVLRDLHEGRELLGSEVTLHNFYKYGESLVSVRPRWFDALDRQCTLARTSDRYAELRAAIARRVPPPAELVDAMEALAPSEPLSSDEFLRRVQALRTLARRRLEPGGAPA